MKNRKRRWKCPYQRHRHHHHHPPPLSKRLRLSASRGLSGGADSITFTCPIAISRQLYTALSVYTPGVSFRMRYCETRVYANGFNPRKYKPYGPGNAAPRTGNAMNRLIQSATRPRSSTATAAALHGSTTAEGVMKRGANHRLIPPAHRLLSLPARSRMFQATRTHNRPEPLCAAPFS